MGSDRIGFTLELDGSADIGYNDTYYPACHRKESNKMTSPIQIKGYLVEDHGTWTVRARFPGASNKEKLHSKSTGLSVDGHNKRKAELLMRDIVARWEKEVNTDVPRENPTFEVLIQKWLGDKKLSIRPNTLQSYIVPINAHIVPELGSIPIRDMTREKIQRYYERMRDAGLSKSTIKKHHVIISGVIKSAIIDGYISTNVADNVLLPKGKRFEGNVLDEAQVAHMLDETEMLEEPVRAAITLAFIYGLRRSEICGLRWSDVDFENGVIHIRNTVTEYGSEVYETEETKTKTSRRELYLIPSTVDYFLSIKDSQERLGISNGKVCVHQDGHTVRPAYISRSCMRFLRRCGFDNIRLHDLRHTAATILAKRVPVKQVQHYLGHEDIQTTLKYYVHILDQDAIDTGNVMGNFLEQRA